MSEIVSRKATSSLGQPAQQAEEREVGLGDGFEEPVFLKKVVVFRVPDERQMRVEDERERGGMALVILGAAEGSALRWHKGFSTGSSAALGMTSTKRAAEILEPIEALLDHVDARRVAQADGAIVAESHARE